MEYNRIQKLLLSEYCALSDTVLIESPFAQTTRDGRGLRAVSLGLTTSNLIIAADVLKKNSDFRCPPGLDPSIESFELVSIFPLECVSLSVFRRRRRRTLKARLVDGRVCYYELGGMERRGMFWTLWCERVKSIVDEKKTGSSLSETTAASSSSASSLYLLSSEVESDGMVEKVGGKSVCRIWMHYGGAGDGVMPTWPRKDLFLGPEHAQLGYGYYSPVPVRFAGASLDDLKYELNDQSPEKPATKRSCNSWSGGRKSRSVGKQRTVGVCDVLFTRDKNVRRIGVNFATGFRRNRRGNRRPNVATPSGISEEGCGMVPCDQNQKGSTEEGCCGADEKQLGRKLSRFGFGVAENCGSGLCLAAREHKRTSSDPFELIESSVRVWEADHGRGDRTPRVRKLGRHPRRYAVATAAHFLNALGPWSVQPGERESVQGRRALSAVGIRRQPPDPELRLPVSRRQLAASISATDLDPGRSGLANANARGRIVLFWTPEYWYRPRAATVAYQELRQHLDRLREFQTTREKPSAAASTTLRRFFSRQKVSVDCAGDEQPSRILDRILFANGAPGAARVRRKDEGRGTTRQLRRSLRMELRVTAWDIDSSTLARQLTLVDRDLFLRIPPGEMEVVVFQRSSRNTPNLGAWIAFSHRMSCLVASEVLAVKPLESRARLLARFINTAVKCHAGGTFHSCRSVLAGLQSPGIYRLKDTWRYLRIHHSTKYQIMERLCKIYRNPRTARYRKTWLEVESHPPCMPYVGDLLARLLDISRARRRSRVDEGQKRSCELANRTLLLTRRDHIEISDRTIEPKPRSSLARRILSAAIFRFKASKSDSKTPNADAKATTLDWRQHILARRAFDRWQLFVIDARNARSSNDPISKMDDRRQRVVEVATWLADCQRSAQSYSYPIHSLAWEFLLKARYKEDRDNFFASLKLEPRTK